MPNRRMETYRGNIIVQGKITRKSFQGQGIAVEPKVQVCTCIYAQSVHTDLLHQLNCAV